MALPLIDETCVIWREERHGFDRGDLSTSEGIERLARDGRVIAEDAATVTLTAPAPSARGTIWFLLRLGRGRVGRDLLERERVWLEAAPVAVIPTISAWGRIGAGWFLLSALGSSPEPLDDALREAEGCSREAVAVLLGRAGRAVRCLHQAALLHGSLAAWKLFVIDGREVFVSDLSRARRRHLTAPWGRANDLSMLAATIPHRLLERGGLDRLLAEAGVRGRLARRAVEAGIVREHARGVVPRLVPTVALTGPHLEIRCHRAFRELFRVDGPEQEMLRDARVEEVRRLEDRINYRIIVPAGEGSETGREQVFYMKSFHGSLEARDVGPREWCRTILVAAAGVPTALPAATGRSEHGSFFMSRAVRDGEPLDRLLVEGRPERAEERKRLAHEVAGLVAGLHRAGLCHRDLYLCHLLVGSDGLHLIDLQRVDLYRCLPRHRRVKDLGALHYASLATPVRATERLRVLDGYLRGIRAAGAGGAGPSWLHKRRWIRLIERKAARIARHAGPPRVAGKERP